MEIETYEIEEAMTETGTTPEIEAQALELIEKLDLEGQKSLTVETDEGVDTRIPYPEMTSEDEAVYDELFEQKTAVRDYSAGILPVRVLQVVGHAVDLFEEVKVWHRKTQDPDPILVGYQKIAGTTKKFLLARWGEALKSMEALREEATEKLTRRWTASAKNTIAEAQAFLAGIDGKVAKKLQGSYVSTPFY